MQFDLKTAHGALRSCLCCEAILQRHVFDGNCLIQCLLVSDLLTGHVIPCLELSYLQIPKSPAGKKFRRDSSKVLNKRAVCQLLLFFDRQKKCGDRPQNIPDKTHNQRIMNTCRNLAFDNKPPVLCGILPSHTLAHDSSSHEHLPPTCVSIIQKVFCAAVSDSLCLQHARACQENTIP